jgi:hypothetical protein
MEAIAEDVCRSCGKHYTDVSGTWLELCPECLATKPLYKLTWVNWENEPCVEVAAGVGQVDQIVSEECYWPYQEFSLDDWKALEAHGLGDRGTVSGETLPEVQASVDLYLSKLQRMWDEGMRLGLMTTEEFRKKWTPWPLRFAATVEAGDLADPEVVEAYRPQ